MIDLLHVKTFVTVAKTKNFNRAAALLGYSQSSVTHHIKMLERELGASLFERSRFARSIALTEVGHAVLRYSHRLIALAAETKAAAMRLRSTEGKIRSSTNGTKSLRNLAKPDQPPLRPPQNMPRHRLRDEPV